MDNIQLEQIEADVVVVFFNEHAQSTLIKPYWECKIEPNEILKNSIQQGLEFNESCGMGDVVITIHDFRKLITKEQ